MNRSTAEGHGLPQDDETGSLPAVIFEVVEKHIALVTLNRPSARNAINAAVALGLDAAVKTIEQDPEIRVAILYSSHARAFCAGADLKEIADGGTSGLSTPDGGFAGFVDAKREKPWIAAVRGFALAGGFELTLSCDMIVASEDASFGLPEVKRGLFAGGGGVYRLPQVLPRNVALELIATGDVLTAQRAKTFGLANYVVPSDEVLNAALALARTIALNAPLSVRASLNVARLASEMPGSDLRALSLARAESISHTHDAIEGPRAFLEKRAAVWRGV
jgi:enoyl-CoA hydratase/carnithine racemase